MEDLKGRTVFITGASRGIGREIALRCARDGANLALAAKTVKPHPKLPGTIHTVAAEVERAGGRALAIPLDVRDEQAIEAAMARAADAFGGIDALVNNASAIALTRTPDTTAKHLDLMLGVNVRATFLASRAGAPYLKRSANAHILNLSPPPSLKARWFKDHTAYTISKYGMSLCTLGMAAEFAADGIAVNSLWPRTTIATAAIEFNFPPEILRASRKPAIVADAAHSILCRDSRAPGASGNFHIDEDVLRAAGVTDFAPYAVTCGVSLYPDLFVD